MLWPVLAIMLRVVLVFVGGIFLSRGQAAEPEHFYWLIAAGMTLQAIVTAAAIRLGAWNRGRYPQASHAEEVIA
ncbi:hypothetical protein ES703_118217 [subsurface metagenome]